MSATPSNRSGTVPMRGIPAGITTGTGPLQRSVYDNISKLEDGRRRVYKRRCPAAAAVPDIPSTSRLPGATPVGSACACVRPCRLQAIRQPRPAAVVELPGPFVALDVGVRPHAMHGIVRPVALHAARPCSRPAASSAAPQPRLPSATTRARTHPAVPCGPSAARQAPAGWPHGKTTRRCRPALAALCGGEPHPPGPEPRCHPCLPARK